MEVSVTHSLHCDEALRQLDDYLDRHLSREEVRLVEAHLAVCAACASLFHFEQRYVDVLRDRLQRIAVPPDFTARLLSHLSSVCPPTIEPELPA